jgi:protein-S-isoprenylcysteine O-methyltransferase Ste14
VAVKSLFAFAFSYRGVLVALCPLCCALPPWIAIDPRAQTAGGALLLLVGTWLRLAGVREIGGRARVHSAGARELMTSGIFARTRNPLYLGNSLAAAGAIGLLAGPLAALAAGLYLGLLYALVVRHEERVLEALWGDAYRAYLQRVPRWIPKLAVAPVREGAHAPFAWSEVLRLEKWGVLAVVGAIALRLGFPSAIDALMQRAETRAACAALALLVFAVLFTRRAARSKRKHGLLFQSE